MTDKKKPAELKISLLSKGIDFDIGMFEDYPRPFYDNQFVYGQTSKGATPKHRFPQVLLLGDGVVSALLRREGSVWNLKREGLDIILMNEGRVVQTIGLPERPAYFDKTLKDGTPSHSIVAVAGEDTPGFFLYPDCYYFSMGDQCGFCGIRGTRKSVGKYMVSEFSDKNVAEATRLFQRTEWRNIPLVSITMGTCRTDDETRRYGIHPIRVMYDALEPKIPIHVLAHPPNDFRLIEEFKEAGVTSIAFNLEVADRDRFAEICPGKAKFYGYDKWMEALYYAREVFGEYNVYCGLVWGFEPPENVIRFYDDLLSQGMGIASNIYHADPRCPLRNHPHPSEDTILEIARAQSDLYMKYPTAGTIFSVSMRSTIDWEIHRGDFRHESLH